MSKILIYHNPRCSKSRCALKLLDERNLDYEVIEYLKSPPNEETLATICDQLDIEPSALVRSKERLFKELALNLKDHRTRQDWLKILAENPKLLERPIVVSGNRAAIGRPTENILAIL